MYSFTGGAASPVLVANQSTAIGSTAYTSDHVGIQSAVSGDTAFIYMLVPNNGFMCYKFYDAATVVPSTVNLEMVYDTIVVAQTGFESSEGFTASNTYNQPVASYGPDSAAWMVFFGCVSTNNKITGAQSLQMRWYTATSDSLGYAYTNFNTDSLALVRFTAKSTNNLNVNMQYALNATGAYGHDSIISLSATPTVYHYNMAQNGLQDVRVKFNVSLPSTTPTATSAVIIDDVQFCKVRESVRVYAPVITPASSTITDSVTVTMSCATEGATIYYTTNGDVPTDTSTVYQDAFVVPLATTTIKAIAMLPGVSSSEVTTVVYTYVPENKIATPIVNRPAGSYTEPMNIMLTCPTPDVDIYYTLDGSTPDSTSNLYSIAFLVDSSCTLKAIAYKTGMIESDILSVIYVYPVIHNVSSISNLYQTAIDSADYKLVNPVTVAYQNFKSIYVTDSTGWLLIFGDSVDSYTNGDVLTGVVGTYVTYQGVGQLIDYNLPTPEQGTAVSPVVKTIPSITVQDVYMYVKVEYVKFTSDVTYSTSSTTSGTVSDGTNSLTVRNNFRVINQTYKTGDVVTITGFVSVYQGAVQLYPNSIVLNAGAGVDALNLDNLYVKDGVVYVPAEIGQTIEVYSITGQSILNVKANQELMPISGLPMDQLLLVKRGNQTTKVIVK